MTPRCFPADPTFEHYTERAVWEALCERLPDDAALIANQCFTERHGDCEADLIVALPGAGIAVLEVKGGHVSHDGLTWRQTGGRARNRAIDPAGQARRAMHALRSYLDRDPRWRRRRVRLARAVVLPTSTIGYDVNPTDCPRWMVADASQIPNLANVIRDIVIQQESVDLAGEREAEVELLTSQQSRVLDLIRDIPRVEVRRRRVGQDLARRRTSPSPGPGRSAGGADLLLPRLVGVPASAGGPARCPGATGVRR